LGGLIETGRQNLKKLYQKIHKLEIIPVPEFRQRTLAFRIHLQSAKVCLKSADSYFVFLRARERALLSANPLPPRPEKQQNRAF
jgi:hypothetical protein